MEILGIGPTELLFVILIAILVMGPEQMRNAGRIVARWTRTILMSDALMAIRQVGRFGFAAAHVSDLERAGYTVESSVAPLFYEAHKGGPVIVDIRTRPDAHVYPMVPAGAPLNDMIDGA